MSTLYLPTTLPSLQFLTCPLSRHTIAAEPHLPGHTIWRAPLCTPGSIIVCWLPAGPAKACLSRRVGLGCGHRRETPDRARARCGPRAAPARRDRAEGIKSENENSRTERLNRGKRCGAEMKKIDVEGVRPSRECRRQELTCWSRFHWLQ